MIQKKLRQFFKNNLSAILFFGLIFFGVSSFWLKNSQEANYAKEIIDYAEVSVPTLRTKFATIIKNTQSLANTDESYTKFFKDLNELEKNVLDLAAKVPSKSGDTDIRKLEQALKDFILTVKEESIKNIRSEYEQRKIVKPYQENYAEIKTVLASPSPTKENLQKSYESGLRVLEFNRYQEKSTKNIQSQAAQKTNNDSLENTLKSVKTILEASSQNLSSEQKSSLQNLFKAGWPVQPLVFAGLQQSALETDTFVSDIKQLQQLVKTVRQKFNLV